MSKVQLFASIHFNQIKKRKKNREKVKLMVLILERPKERGVGYSDPRREKNI